MPRCCVVALAHHCSAPGVPEHRDEDVHRRLRALDVTVERLPELRGVVRRDEWVDEHDAVLGFDVDAADILVPLLVKRGPAPEAGSDLENVHRATLNRTDLRARAYRPGERQGGSL